MKKSICFLSLSLSTLSLADTPFPAEYDQIALPSYASYDHLAHSINSHYTGNLGSLCPATKQEYAANLDAFQTKIDGIVPNRCYAWISLGFGFGSGGRHCVWRGKMMIDNLEEKKYPIALCYELHTLQEAYDLVVANSTILNEEKRTRVNQILTNLGTCLKESKKRSEIENCYVSFKNDFTQILAL